MSGITAARMARYPRVRVLVVNTSREEYGEQGSEDGGAWYDAPIADRHSGSFEIGGFYAGEDYARVSDDVGMGIGDQDETDNNILVIKETLKAPKMITHLPRYRYSAFSKGTTRRDLRLFRTWEICGKDVPFEKLP